MPSSPIVASISKEVLNRKLIGRMNALRSTYYYDKESAHFFSLLFARNTNESLEPSYAYLMCCYEENNPAVEDNWYHVEEEIEESLSKSIEKVFGVKF